MFRRLQKKCSEVSNLSCLNQLRNDYKSDCDIEKVESLNVRLPLTKILLRFSSDYDVQLFDPFEIVCPQKTCKPSLDGNQMFIDQNHISKLASIMIAAEFVKVVEK